MKFKELSTAKMGSLGEQAAMLAVRRDGFSVIASCKFTGDNDNEPPVLESENRREILPDADVCKRGQRFWLEIKTYAEAAWNRTYRCHVHGISVRHFDNYVAVEERTGSAVFLAINELKTGLLLLSNLPLSAMQKYPCLCGCKGIAARHRSGSGVRGPQWYFDRDTFHARWRHDNKTIEFLRSAHERLIKPSHAMQRHGGVAAPKQTSFLLDEPTRGGGMHGDGR